MGGPQDELSDGDRNSGEPPSSLLTLPYADHEPDPSAENDIITNIYEVLRPTHPRIRHPPGALPPSATQIKNHSRYLYGKWLIALGAQG